MKAKSHTNDGPTQWVWVTTPEYYLEADGSDREILDPEVQRDAGGWTCHRDTRKGDLIILYRTKPKMDFGYFIQAESDAYSIVGEESADERGWQYHLGRDRLSFRRD